MTSAPLNAENLDWYVQDDGILMDTTVLGWFRSNGYNIEAINELQAVSRDSSDKAHLVANLEVSTKPSDDPDYDAAVDTADVWACECGDFTHRQFPDLREFGNDPTDAGSCVHIEACDKSERAANDENQDTLL